MDQSRSCYVPRGDSGSTEVPINGARGATMYVARVDSKGYTRIARPCDRCMQTLYDAGIREVVYTNNEGTYTVERVPEFV